LEEINKIPKPWNDIMFDLLLNIFGWIGEEESTKKSDRIKLSIRKKEPFQKRIIKAIKECNPEYCGITFTTTLSEEAESIAKLIKTLNPRIKIISGGPHSSIMPKEVLNGSFDIAVIGEGEITLKNILLQKPFKSIKGIAYKEKNKIKINPPQELIENLDSLPMPDYSVFNIKEYHTPRINCKKNPIAAIETSRGCVYNCIYCNNKVFGRCFRAKSAKRTVDEIEHILKFGFKEIHVWDDGFSTDLNRAKDICKEILKRKLKVTWNIYNGLRVDRIDRELLFLLKKSGCYRISLGVESGNQSILNRINKGTKVEDIKKAFKIANEVGIDTVAFCIIGLPDETEETMKQTIDLILEINGQKIDEKNLLSSIVQQYLVGDKIKIKILRSGKEMELEVVLEERKF